MHSALWSISQQLIRQALVAAFMFVIARRVTPFEFGLIGIANIWNNFLALFLELGFCATLVQRKQIGPGLIASAFLLNALAGAALLFLNLAFAGQAAGLLNAPEARPVIMTLSISFFILAIASPQIALAQREFRFKQLALRDCAAQSLAALVGISLAFAGFGVWAAVANSLLVNAFLALFVWRLTAYRLEFHEVTRESLRDVWTFGSKVFAFTGFKYLLRTADSILVGVLFGPEKLGLYNFSQRVTVAPTKAVQIGLAAFLFPKASTLQDNPGDLKDLFLSSYSILNYLVLTFSALLLTIGSELILLLFGQQWQPAIDLIRILIAIQFLAPAIVPMAEVLKAANRPNWILFWSILVVGLTATALAIGAQFGFRHAIAAMTLVWWLTLPIAFWILDKVVQIDFAEFWRKVRLSYELPGTAALFMFLLASHTELSLYLRLAAVSAILLVQFAAMYRFDPIVRHFTRTFLHKRQ